MRAKTVLQMGLVGLWALCVAVPAPAEPPGLANLPRRGLIAYWPGDGDARDAAGKSPGTLQNKVKFAPGVCGQAFVFDGNGSHVEVPADIFGDRRAFTYSCWLKSDGGGYFLTQGSDCSDGAPTYKHCATKTNLLENGQVQVEVVGPQTVLTGHFNTLNSEGRLRRGQWHHLAVVFEAGELALYIDGRRDAAKTAFFDYSTAGHKPTDKTRFDRTGPTPEAVRIGAKYSYAGRVGHLDPPFYRGLLDELAVWDRALPAEEIAGIAASTEAEGAALDPAVVRLQFVERTPGAERLALADGQVLVGTVQNESLTLASMLGELKMAGRDIAALAPTKDGNSVWLLLNDGQALRGKLAEKSLRVRLTAGSVVDVPVSSVKQLGWRTAGGDANAPTPAARRLVLADGQRLNWCEMKDKPRLRTAYGLVDLPGERLVRITASRAGTHRVQFANGATLAGTLLPEKLTFKLALGPDLAVDGRSLRSLTMPAEPEDAGAQAVLTTRDGDSLIGLVADERLTVRTPYGDVALPPGSLPSLTFDANEPLKAAATQWNGTVLRGALAEKEITFTIGRNGPSLKVPVARIASITRTVVLPPLEIVKRVEKLIAQLGAESYRDRDAAQKELEALGSGVVPLLRPHLQSADIEVRQRVEQILEKVGVRP